MWGLFPRTQEAGARATRARGPRVRKKGGSRRGWWAPTCLRRGYSPCRVGRKWGGSRRACWGEGRPRALRNRGARAVAHAQEVGARAAHARGPHTRIQEGGLVPRVAGSPNAQEGKARAAPQAEEVGAHGACAGSAARARARSGGSRHVRRKDLPCAGGRTGTTRAGSESSCQGCPARAGNGELALRAQKRKGAPCARWGKS